MIYFKSFCVGAIWFVVACFAKQAIIPIMSFWLFAFMTYENQKEGRLK